MFTGGFVRHVFDKKTCRQERNTELLPPLPLTLLKAHNFYDKFTNCDPLSDMKSKKKQKTNTDLSSRQQCSYRHNYIDSFPWDR